jgi:uncharacterized protein YjbI with pentapeptide repeats
MEQKNQYRRGLAFNKPLPILTCAGVCMAEISKEKFQELVANGEITPNITLPGVDLRDSNLRSAFLVGADLAGAKLQNSNMACANFENANLEGADLRGCNLSYTCFKNANLKNANLKKAYFEFTDFRGANLQGTNFEDTSGQKIV